MTATAQPQVLTRVFKYGTLDLDDPDASATPAEALSYWESSYPILAHASLSAPTYEGDKIIYEVIKPKGETKG